MRERSIQKANGMGEQMNHADMLGRSISDPLVVSYLADHERLDPTDFHKYAEIGHFGGPNSGFSLRADPLHEYLSQFEGIRSRKLPDDQEMIVAQLSFTGADAINVGQRVYSGALPFGLVFGDSADHVASALGIAPFRQDASATLPDYSAERFVFCYAVNRLQVIARHDGAHRLMAVYLLQEDRAALQAKRRRASMHEHRIEPGNVDKIEALRAETPTKRWREAMAEGDELFNEADINEAEERLNAFIDAIKRATGEVKTAGILAAVEELVLGLNEINARTGMIETLERDELGTLIDEVVSATGFKLADGEDITSEWREW